MLRENGIYDVKVVSVQGFLSDHYNPANKTINLSPEVYNNYSISAAAVAAHETGHAVQHATKKLGPDLYQNEYAANEMAILYWRAVGRTTELDQCYQYAKKVVGQLKNPAPEGVDPIQYFNEHYQELGADPYKYGYYQFAQFVKIYEDKALPTFEEYMKKYVAASSNK